MTKGSVEASVNVDDPEAGNRSVPSEAEWAEAQHAPALSFRSPPALGSRLVLGFERGFAHLPLAA